MSELFKRVWSVQVGTFQTSELRVAFTARKSLAKEPHTAEVTIWNLSAESRKRIEQSKGQPLIIEAGYRNTKAVIFSGVVRFASSAREGPDWKTKIESGDGERAYGSAPFKGSFGPGTQTSQVIRRVVSALGVGAGNLESVIGSLPKPSFLRGFAANGRASDVLSNLLKSQGLDFSIQNGAIQLHRKDQPVDSFAVLLSPNTGLIGSPDTSTPKDSSKKTTVKLTSLLQPQFKCGGLVEVRSSFLTGRYMVSALEHQGDSDGKQWYTVIEVQQS